MTIDSIASPITHAIGDSKESIPVQAANRDLIQAVRAVNATDKLGDKNELSFSVDPRTRRPVVKIVNRDTQEVITQIPNEEVLRLAESLKQSE
jgi:flagellar protein FlaG